MQNVSKSISIILPVLDNEKKIETTTKRLLSYFEQNNWDYDLIFVDDGSTDRTVTILDMIRLSDSHVKVLTIPTHLGKGGAIISAALNYPLKQYMAYMDSDLAADPCEIERLLAYIEDYDMVLGSRILRGDLPPIRRSFYRSILSRFYSNLFRILFRMPIHDPQCGFKLFRSEIIPKLFGQIKTTGFAFDSELIVRAFAQGLRIKETPINWFQGDSSSVHVLKEIKLMGLDILSIWHSSHLLWRERKQTYPQKKGSIYGRLLFVLLSLDSEIKNRPFEYLKIVPPTAIPIKSTEVVEQDSMLDQDIHQFNKSQ